MSSLRAARSSLGAVKFSVTRPVGADRYLVIRSFFTRQVQAPPVPSVLALTQRRWYSTPPTKHECPHCSPSAAAAGSTTPKPSAGPRRDHAQDYSPFIKRLIQRASVPMTSSHRPSKEELLRAATSWWERLRIRVKWFTIRGWRRFNTDDMSAFASWFVLGNSEFRSICSLGAG
jgi:distribution and morphology protein 31